MAGSVESGVVCDAGPAAAAPERLALRYKLGFAAGDFSFNLYWHAIGLFLLFFYTDVLGLSPGWAGATFFLASVWDGVNDPLMGLLADRTRTRWGRYRPALLFGALPLAAAFVLAFSVPGLRGGALVAYALATHILLRTAYGALAIPYSSLSARLTRDADDRTSLTGYRMQFAAAGGIAVTFLMPMLVVRLGGDRPAHGYLLATLAIGALATVIFLLAFLNTREPPDRAGEQPPAARTLEEILADARGFLATVPHSVPLISLLLGNAISSGALSLMNKNLLYFFKYALHDVALAGLVLPLLAVVNILATPLWVRVIRHSSKRAAWLAGCALVAAGCIAFGLAPPRALPAGLAALIVISAGNAAFGVCFWSMLPDIVEFTQWKFDRWDEAKIFGFASFAQKVALGLSAVLVGLTLDAIGLVPNTAPAPATLEALRQAMALLPLLGMAASAAIIRRYPIDGAYHRRILAELARRRAA